MKKVSRIPCSTHGDPSRKWVDLPRAVEAVGNGGCTKDHAFQ